MVMKRLPPEPVSFPWIDAIPEKVWFLTSSTSIMVEVEFLHGSFSMAAPRSFSAGLVPCPTGELVLPPAGERWPSSVCSDGEANRTRLGFGTPLTELLVFRTLRRACGARP